MPMPREADPSEPSGTARALRDQLASGQLTATDLATATLARIREREPGLRAFASLLDEASARDQASRLTGPLAGIPVAVKDIFDTADLPTGYGSPIVPFEPARQDGAMVSLLRTAGALVIGKATTTEFAFLNPTGTLNPRAPGHTPGGSSAGSAAAVAAGVVPLAIGTQTGGSVIRPASYCGVVGYKPSFGWLPTVGMKCFSWSLDTVGLFARDVADVAWFGEAVTGRALSVTAAGATGPLVVALPRAYVWGEVTASAQRALDRATEALRSVGIEVRTVDLPDAVTAGYDAHAAIQGWEASRCLVHEFRHHRERLSPVLRDYLAEASAIDASAYEAGQRVAAKSRAVFSAWFDGFDAVLTPSAPDEAPAGFASTGSSSFNRLWTLIGGPCVSVPGCVGVSGLPMGVQLVGPHGTDARVIEAARRLEASLAARG
jgi:Asp-tRNA(Asn)/Glu-tRNA(Gln) amidotransferase A subunit family amidase